MYRRFNDDIVTPMPVQEALGTSAYILFYEVTGQSLQELLARNVTTNRLPDLGISINFFLLISLL